LGATPPARFLAPRTIGPFEVIFVAEQHECQAERRARCAPWSRRGRRIPRASREEWKMLMH
jgi:hypothetical protein